MRFYTFYTPHYRGLVRSWRESLSRHKFKYHADEIPTTRSWREAVVQKPSRILAHLAKQREPIVWLDVDGKMMREPTLLMEAEDDYDVAGYVHPEHDRGLEHIMTGTLWFNTTEAAVEVLACWDQLEQRTLDVARAGQPNLWHVLKVLKPRLLRLPVSYCRIRQRHDDEESAVFLHQSMSLKYGYGDEHTSKIAQARMQRGFKPKGFKR